MKPLESSYENNCSNLYKRIETATSESEWGAILRFIDTGYWPNNIFADKVSPKHQAMMWITRLDSTSGASAARSRMLPLHLAISRGAPLPVVSRLIELYPHAVHITDDQGMLPIQLALQGTTNDAVLECALRAENAEQTRAGLLDTTSTRFSHIVSHEVNATSGEQNIARSKEDYMEAEWTEAAIHNSKGKPFGKKKKKGKTWKRLWPFKRRTKSKAASNMAPVLVESGRSGVKKSQTYPAGEDADHASSCEDISIAETPAHGVWLPSVSCFSSGLCFSALDDTPCTPSQSKGDGETLLPESSVPPKALDFPFSPGISSNGEHKTSYIPWPFMRIPRAKATVDSAVKSQSTHSNYRSPTEPSAASTVTDNHGIEITPSVAKENSTLLAKVDSFVSASKIAHTAPIKHLSRAACSPGYIETQSLESLLLESSSQSSSNLSLLSSEKCSDESLVEINVSRRASNAVEQSSMPTDPLDPAKYHSVGEEDSADTRSTSKNSVLSEADSFISSPVTRLLPLGNLSRAACAPECADTLSNQSASSVGTDRCSLEALSTAPSIAGRTRILRSKLKRLRSRPGPKVRLAGLAGVRK